jgi:hypothetical protein
MTYIYMNLSIFINDQVGHDQRSPFISRANSVQSETTRQTCNTAEQRLKRFRQMMRDIISKLNTKGQY